MPKQTASSGLLKGRLAQGPHKALQMASVSVTFDKRLAPYDIQGSLAHARMLFEASLISRQEFDDISRGLKILDEKVSKEEFSYDSSLEDVHMNLEKALTDLIGQAGAKLHTARSRNDQVATDERLFLIDNLRIVENNLFDLRLALVNRAKKAGPLPMPGYTHLQRAQPVLVAHHLMAYYQMLTRDRERLLGLESRLKVMPLGSGALAGTGLPIKPRVTASLLGFTSLAPNSLDAVASRDLLMEFLSISAIMAVHLSRLAEDLILWCSQEFNFAALPDNLTTTSSMMPHKKNPDGAELIRGKAGRTIGNLVTLLTVVKGLPMSYNRDLQEDKEPLFDTIDTLNLILPLATAMIESIEFKEENLKKAADDPFMAATDLADHLVQKGVPFRLAHEQVGRLVVLALSKNIALRDLEDSLVLKYCPEAEPGLVKKLSLDNLLAKRDTTPGGTAPAVVSLRIKEALDELDGEKRAKS
ncbi:MAG: argininosuccinate lyase [Deltaproteobacteria bacterium]|nr:argininosuccinate lyase [Deltaproteobacteria bacterium]